MLKEKKITYEDIQEILISSHFYPEKEVTLTKSKNVTTALHVKVPIPIRANNIVDRLKEILEGVECSINYLSNHFIVEIKLK